MLKYTLLYRNLTNTSYDLHADVRIQTNIKRAAVVTGTNLLINYVTGLNKIFRRFDTVPTV